jgi:hypothetical protein
VELDAVDAGVGQREGNGEAPDNAHDPEGPVLSSLARKGWTTAT